MRPLFMLTLLASPPALAAAPQCALQATVAIAAVAQPDTPTSKPSVADVPTLLAATPHSATALPQALASIPFVHHVASADATVTDFGLSHGVRSISARNGDQFMIFQITPEKQAAVSGGLTDLTATQLTMAANGDVTPLPAQHGLDGLFVSSGSVRILHGGVGWGGRFPLLWMGAIGLPHKRLADNAVWAVKTDHVSLVIQPGYRHGSDAPVPVGVPYGSRARLICLYLQSEALKTNT